MVNGHARVTTNGFAAAYTYRLNRDQVAYRYS